MSDQPLNAIAQQYVCRFDVTMNQTLLMSRGEPRGNLAADAKNFDDRHLPSPTNPDQPFVATTRCGILCSGSSALRTSPAVTVSCGCRQYRRSAAGRTDHV